MRTQELRDELPGFERLQALSPIRQKRTLEHAVEVILRAIESQKDLPDLWESDNLVRAMGSILRGQYALAAAELERALEPPEVRDPHAKLDQAEPWAFSRLNATLRALRALPPV